MSSAASAVSLDLIESGDDPVAESLAALGLSGLTVVGGSETFVGRVGDGNLAQSATYSDFVLTGASGLPDISIGDGLFLTSGVADIPQTNTDTSFDHNSVGVDAPGTGGDADLSQLALDAGLPSSEINDVNIFEFEFTVDDPANNAIALDFVFGSDEFPDQSVTDIFAVFVDGVNFARFQDGSLVSFVEGVNAGNFNDNNVGSDNYDLEYDGISNRLLLEGLLDTSLTTHSIKIAIADTSDSIFDSGVFLSNLRATFTEGQGGVTPDPEIPGPAPFALLLAGLGALGWARRRRG